jgi:hypothetical protein
MIDKVERDKFLTELIGICFLEDHSCSKCTLENGGINRSVGRRVRQSDFSTWDNFGLLITFIKDQEWFFKFVSYIEDYGSWIEILSPDKLAYSVYSFKSRMS